MSEFILPETRYALSDDVNIAYQVLGNGPVDIVMVPGFVSHVEFQHEAPGYTAFFAAAFRLRPRDYFRQKRARIV